MSKKFLQNLERFKPNKIVVYYLLHSNYYLEYIKRVYTPKDSDIADDLFVLTFGKLAVCKTPIITNEDAFIKRTIHNCFLTELNKKNKDKRKFIPGIIDRLNIAGDMDPHLEKIEGMSSQTDIVAKNLIFTKPQEINSSQQNITDLLQQIQTNPVKFIEATNEFLQKLKSEQKKFVFIRLFPFADDKKQTLPCSTDELFMLYNLRFNPKLKYPCQMERIMIQIGTNFLKYYYKVKCNKIFEIKKTQKK